jgi:hypothetical protein
VKIHRVMPAGGRVIAVLSGFQNLWKTSRQAGSSSEQQMATALSSTR